MATVRKQKQDGYTVSLEIEASNDEVEKSLDAAFKKLVKNAKVAGFRQGKVPRAIFERNYGSEIIFQEAVPDIINAAYLSAIDELKLKVVDFPKNVNILSAEPGEAVSFSCDVDVEPTIKLGKYKGIKVTKLPDSVDDSKVEEQINQIRESYAEYKESENPAAKDDILLCKMTATINEAVYEPWTRDNVGVKLGVGTFGDEFDTELTGAKKDEQKLFSITYPDDFATDDVAGKTVSFDVTLIDIKQKQLAELNDDFAKKVANVDTVDELKKLISDNLNAQAKQDSDAKLHDDLLTAIVEDMKADIPPAMVEREMDNALQQFKTSIQQQSQMTFDQYLAATQKTESDIRDSFRENSELRVKGELALEEIMSKEKIDVNDDDLQAEIEKWNMPDIKTLDEFMKSQYAANLDPLKAAVKRQKTLDFIVDKAKVTEEKASK